ncbi:MAG: hypothetical protein GY850_03710 [bacterium]|nr:hypothetical protein [bacterium]
MPVYQGLIDRTRQYMDVPKLCTIFGYKNRPHNRRGKKPKRLQRILGQSAYDLMKLRGKKLVQRIGKTRCYRIKSAGIRILAGLPTLREKVIKTVLDGLGKPRVGRPPTTIHPIDQTYINLQHELRLLLVTHGLVA